MPEGIDPVTGHLPFADLKKNWSDDRRARNQARKAEIAVEYATLEEQRLEVQQPAVSKLTGRSDTRISALRDLIEAMGGELQVTAKFADLAAVARPTQAEERRVRRLQRNHCHGDCGCRGCHRPDASESGAI